MCDFLKAYPFMTIEDYFWKYSMPFIKIMTHDATYTKYLTEAQRKKKEDAKNSETFEDALDFAASTGALVIG